MNPWDELAAELELRAAAADPPIVVNVHATPPANVSVPALVIRPDEPWLEQTTTDPFGRASERIVVIAVVGSSDSPSAYAELRELVRLVLGVEGYGAWSWRSASGIVPMVQDGITYLGTTVRLTHSSEGIG